VRILLSDMDPRHEALVNGDDPADLIGPEAEAKVGRKGRRGRGVYRDERPEDIRGSDLDVFADHVRLLATGGQLDDPADDLC